MKFVIDPDPGAQLTQEERQARGGDGFYYHASNQPLLRVKLLLKTLESTPEMRVNKRINPIYRIPSLQRLVEDIDQAHKGVARLHAGAVVTPQGEGVLLVGLSDVGKTTLSVRLCTLNGHALLGDDMVRLAKDGTLTRWQNQIGIFPHKDNFEGIPLSPAQRVERVLRYAILSRPPLANMRNPNLVIPYKQLPHVADQAPLKHVVLLEKGDPGIHEISMDVLARKVLATSMEIIKPEGFPGRMLHRYCFYNDMLPHFLELKTQDILASALPNTKVVRLTGWSPFDFHRLYTSYAGI